MSALKTLTHAPLRRRRLLLPGVTAVTPGLASPRLASLAPTAGAAGRPPISGTSLVTDPASYVNPFIGTTNAADDFPGADVPFGMVQWSPDTPSRPDGGGYEYNDASITGFSLTHLSGPGCPAEGDVPVLPTVGAVDTSASDSFSHTNESASPGYYSVTTDNGVTTELTTTTRSGMARFTFPATTQANLIFKLNDSANGDSNTQFNVVSDTEVSGQVTSGNFCGGTNSAPSCALLVCLERSIGAFRAICVVQSAVGCAVAPRTRSGRAQSSGVHSEVVSYHAFTGLA